MDINRYYGNIFSLGGTNKLQRLPVALESDYIVSDERSNLMYPFYTNEATDV